MSWRTFHHHLALAPFGSLWNNKVDHFQWLEQDKALEVVDSGEFEWFQGFFEVSNFDGEVSAARNSFSKLPEQGWWWSGIRTRAPCCPIALKWRVRIISIVIIVAFDILKQMIQSRSLTPYPPQQVSSLYLLRLGWSRSQSWLCWVPQIRFHRNGRRGIQQCVHLVDERVKKPRLCSE